MPGTKIFKVRVVCSAADGQKHEHELEIAGGRPALGARSEGSCEMQYTCPQSGQDRKVTFDCPPGFSRPYRVARVT
jgi:hypothetical protein